MNLLETIASGFALLVGLLIWAFVAVIAIYVVAVVRGVA